MKEIKILITGCGSHSKTLVRCLKDNVEHRPVSVIGINNSEANILRSEVDKFILAPGIHDPEYTDWLLDLCIRENVDVLLPYITAELPIAAQYREKLESKGIRVSVASADAIAVANDKMEMAKRFHDIMPRQTVVVSSNEVMRYAKSIGYYTGTSLCCKLSGKCGGTGFAILDEKKYLDISLFNRAGFNRYISIDQLCEIVDKVNVSIILQEYVSGTDYSVCVLADHGKVKLMCGLAGYQMEFGAVVCGEIVKNDAAYRIAERVVREIGLDGNACFDFIIQQDGKPVLLECNPRISASVPFIAKAGADFVYLRCKQLLGEPFETNVDFQYGLKMAKYYECFYYQ